MINNSTGITNHSATLIDDLLSKTIEISHNSGILVNDMIDHLPIITMRKENLVIIKDLPMVSYMKASNIGK